MKKSEKDQVIQKKVNKINMIGTITVFFLNLTSIDFYNKFYTKKKNSKLYIF